MRLLQQLRDHKKLLRLCAFGSVYTLLLIGSYIALQNHIDRTTTENVFVYDELQSHIPRLMACRCISQLTPAILSGYQYSESNLAANASTSVTGGITHMTKTELERLDTYQQTKHQLTRAAVQLGGISVWIYK